jgi:hypothetical protein
MIGALFFLAAAVLTLISGGPLWLIVLFVLGIFAGLYVEANS